MHAVLKNKATINAIIKKNFLLQLRKYKSLAQTDGHTKPCHFRLLLEPKNNCEKTRMNPRGRDFQH